MQGETDYWQKNDSPLPIKKEQIALPLKIVTIA